MEPTTSPSSKSGSVAGRSSVTILGACSLCSSSQTIASISGGGGSSAISGSGGAVGTGSGSGAGEGSAGAGCGSGSMGSGSGSMGVGSGSGVGADGGGRFTNSAMIVTSRFQVCRGGSSKWTIA